MPERILFVQLLFCHSNTLLICNKNYYFSIESLLCSVHRTGSAQWDACSIFLFIIIWKPIVQCFIYSRLHRLCSGTEYRISSLLLLSQSSLHYGVLDFFLISISYNSYYSHILAILHTESWFLLGQKETEPKTGDKFVPWRDRKYTAAVISRATGEASSSLLGYSRKWRNIPQFLHTTTSFWQKQARLLFGVALTSAGTVCATRILKEGISHLCSPRGTRGASQAPQSRQQECTYTQIPQTPYKSQLWFPVTESSKVLSVRVPDLILTPYGVGASDDFINTNSFVHQSTPFLFHLEFWTGTIL